MKFKHLGLAFILVLLVSVFNPDLQPVYAAGATISGKVTDEHGSPLDNVLVLTDGTGYQQTNTNSSGYYILNGVGAGAVHLRASTAGRAFSNYWNYVIVDGGTYTVDFTLRPGGGTLQGRILDGSGNGSPNAFVQVWENTGVGSSGTDNGAYTQTNADGSGYFTTSPTQDGGFPTGTVRVMATVASTSGFNYSVPVWSSQTTSDVQVSIVTGTGSISGNVADASNGTRLSGVTVIADSGIVMAGNTTDSSGNYAIISLPGSGYNVLASKVGYASAHQYNVQVDAGNTPNINFSLTTQIGTITGHVSDSNGHPLANVGIIADSDQGTGFGNAATDSAGDYTLTNLAPMSYFVHAALTGFGRMTKIAVVSNGQNTPNINFTLINASRTISGQVTKDGQPAAYAGIYADGSSGSTYSAYSNTIADANGYYTLTDLPPDLYDVHISGVAGYPSQILYSIDTRAGNVTGLNINLMNGASTIVGHVTDTGGHPLPGVEVQAFQNTNPGTYAVVTTDNNGNYTSSGLWPGLYTYYVSAAGYNDVVKYWVGVQPNGTTRVDFVMGQTPTMVTVPSSVAVLVDSVHGTYQGLSVEVSAGDSASWTASTSASNAPWLLLGPSGDVYQMSGKAGDTLILRFGPDKISGTGLFTTTLTITSPTAASLQVTVSMEKLTALFQMFMPSVLH